MLCVMLACKAEVLGFAGCGLCMRELRALSMFRCAGAYSLGIVPAPAAAAPVPVPSAAAAAAGTTAAAASG